MSEYAKCRDCQQEMEPGTACNVQKIRIGGKMLQRSVEFTQLPEGNNCHDCGAPPGGLHHLGCDMERCPACGHQLISCGCWTDE